MSLEHRVEIENLMFIIYGEVDARGDIHLNKTVSYSAFYIRKYNPNNLSDDDIIIMIMKYYNDILVIHYTCWNTQDNFP